eukprot:1190050-Prorocentrum_minimum.AAC.9
MGTRGGLSVTVPTCDSDDVTVIDDCWATNGTLADGASLLCPTSLSGEVTGEGTGENNSGSLRLYLDSSWPGKFCTTPGPPIVN